MRLGKGIASLTNRLASAAGEFLRRVDAARQSPGMQALARAYNDAAAKDSSTKDWRSDLTSADQAILGDLDTMLGRSRMAVANDGYAASAQGAFGRNVVGTGITARAEARNPKDGKMLRGWNRKKQLLWNKYVRTKELCDAEETKTLAEKQRVWMNELFAAGGLFVIPIYEPMREATRLLLQDIEYEQRDLSRYEHEKRPVRGGIETGDRGQPIAYWLHEAKHPLDDYAMEGLRFLANRVIHIFRQDRVRQRIGAPWMRPVLARLRQLAMYEKYVMLQARTRAANAGFIKQTGATATSMPPSKVATMFSTAGAAKPEEFSSGELRIHIAPGTYQYLKPNQDVVWPKNDTPDSVYPPFVAEQLKAISAGTGLDFATVCRWYSEGNFSSQRQGKLDIQAEVEWIQDLLLIGKALQPVHDLWLDISVREGMLDAPGYFENPIWQAAYRSVNWQGPPKRSIDEIKDEAAWDLKIKGFRATPQQYYNVHGMDAEEVLGEIQEFVELVDERKLGGIFAKWLGMPDVNRPTQGKAPDDPAKRDAAPDDPAAGLAGMSLSDLVIREHILQGMIGDAA